MKEDQLKVFKTIFNHSPISTQLFEPNGETVMVNTAWEQLWNAKFEQVGSYNVLKDKQLEELGIMKYIKRGFKGEALSIPAVKYVTTKTISINGVTPYRWLSAKMFPILDEHGKVTYVVLQHKDVTETIEAANEKKKLISLIDNSSNFVGIFNTNFELSYINKAGKKLIGQNTSAKQTSTLTSLLPSTQLKRFNREIWPRVLQKGKWEGEVEFIHTKTKATIPVLWNLYVIHQDDDTYKEFACVARDISEIKQNQETNAQLAAIVESTDDAIVSKSLDGIIKSWNKGATRIFGYTAAEAIGKHITLIIPDYLKSEEDEIIRKIKAGKRIRHYQTIRQAKNGKLLDISLTISPLKNDAGEIIGASKIARDISKEKKAHEQIRESEERLRFALAAGNIGVWDWDIVNNTIKWTDNVYKIHGVTKKTFTVTFDNFINLIHPDDKSTVTAAIENSLKTRKDLSMEFRVVDPQGSVHWIITKAKVAADQNNIPTRMLGATSDITKQKLIEQEKSDFLSMASHELKTPITSIRMFTDLLQRDLLTNQVDSSVYFATRIKDQMDRLTELTNDLLDVSRIETGKFILNCKKLDLYELVNDTIEQLQTTTKHSIQLSPTKRVVVKADQYRIYQVLVNLLTNAFKYAPNHTDVFVTVTTQKDDAIVRVTDQGIGIAKDKQGKIFERLYQVADPTEKTFPGLGLGLFISKEIITRHNGKIWVESEKGKGATFSFSLPLIQ